MRLRSLTLVIGLIFVPEATVQAAPARWLHVRVEEPGKGEKVNVNVPLAVVETVLPLVNSRHLSQGRVRLAEKGVKVSDLRAIWQSLRAQGDTTLVEVETPDSKLRVYIQENYLRVESDESSRKKIDVRVPAPVVDALLAGQGEELDVAAALEALKQAGDQQIVSVQDDDTTVHVWIDERW